MIALGFGTAEELAEAIYAAEAEATEATGNLAGGRWFSWSDVSPEIRTIKIAAARCLILIYRVEGVAIGLGE